MSLLEATFTALRRSNRRGLITFVTAGDPDIPSSEDVIRAIDRAGADVIEIGVPFSDPAADGPVIQRASERALKAGATLDSALWLVARVRRHVRAPIVLFTYANPVFRMGAEAFADRAASAGVDGVLVVDMPLEESGEMRPLLRRRGIDQIFLVSPTTSDDRIAATGACASGFLYAISRLGVTGVRDTFGRDAAALVGRVRASSRLPVALGFGISSPGHVRDAVRHADAAVVGSSLVRVVEEAGGDSSLSKRVAEHVRWLRTGLEEGE